MCSHRRWPSYVWRLAGGLRRQRPRGGKGRAEQGRAGGQRDSQLSTCHAPGSTHESTCRRATSGRAAAGGRAGLGCGRPAARCSAVQETGGAHRSTGCTSRCRGGAIRCVLHLGTALSCVRTPPADTFDRVVPPPGTAAAWGPACPRPLILPVLACPCCAGLPCRRLVVRLHAHQQKRTMPSSRHRWPPPRPCPSMPIHAHPYPCSLGTVHRPISERREASDLGPSRPTVHVLCMHQSISPPILPTSTSRDRPHRSTLPTYPPPQSLPSVHPQTPARPYVPSAPQRGGLATLYLPLQHLRRAPAPPSDTH